MKFNINNMVMVKLTNAGVDAYCRYYEELGRKPLTLEYDDDGYTEMELWRVMSYFGSEMHNGSALMFETDIIIPDYCVSDKEEPKPKPSSGDVWKEVIYDMASRREMGVEKYGTPLQPNNGRRGLVDAYQESLDLCVYLKQVLMEEK